MADATAQARQLRARVDALRLAAERATEAYDAADAELGRVVSAHVSAQQALDDAAGLAGSNAGTATRRVRAIYMSGGAPALYATVLGGGDISEVLSRLQAVRRVVAGDNAAEHGSVLAVTRQRRAEATLAALATRRSALQVAVGEQADGVRALLAQSDALLSQADAQVRALAEQQRLADETAAASRAAATLAAAQQSATALGTAPLPATAVAAAAIAAATTHLGEPYLWGGTGPTAFDCSGLTLTAYRAAGISLPRTAAEQWFSGPQVALGDLQPGDLLFWALNPADPATIHHVALYVGGGHMIAAPHTGDVVKIEPLYLDGYIGAVRPAPVLR